MSALSTNIKSGYVQATGNGLLSYSLLLAQPRLGRGIGFLSILGPE